MSKEIVMYNDENAAKFVTVSGWVSKDGYFYGDNKDSEHLARYKGCTHRECECGNIMEKHYLYCQKCRDKKDRERHAKREVVEWDGETFLYDHLTENYFKGVGEIEDYLFEHEDVNKEDMLLVLCEPIFFRSIDEDHWCNDLADDCTFEDVASEEVIESIRVLNEELRKCGPVSWGPGSKAVKI